MLERSRHTFGMTEKPPRDQLAKRIVDCAIGNAEDSDSPAISDPDKNPHAVELGRLGGKKVVVPELISSHPKSAAKQPNASPANAGTANPLNRIPERR